MSKRDEFIEKFKHQLDQLNEQLEVLEQKAQKATGEAREDYKRQLEKLREMAMPATEKLAEIKSEGGERWHSLESEAERIYKAFVHSFNYFKSQLRKFE
jgi:vacuolar-type H+-ATPase subunit H